MQPQQNLKEIMIDIAIIGAGGFGREVQWLIERINNVNPIYKIIGYYDDRHFKESINGHPYLGSLDQLISRKDNLSLVMGIGHPQTKKKIYDRISSNSCLDFPNLIDPSVHIDKLHLKIGKGCVICANSIVTVNVILADFVTINLSCTIGHDSVISSYTSIMPSVNISGEVKLGSGVYIGTSATVINQLTIGEFTIVGAGAVVSKSLPARCTAVGIPAKPIKFHD